MHVYIYTSTALYTYSELVYVCIYSTRTCIYRNIVTSITLVIYMCAYVYTYRHSLAYTTYTTYLCMYLYIYRHSLTYTKYTTCLCMYLCMYIYRLAHDHVRIDLATCIGPVLYKYAGMYIYRHSLIYIYTTRLCMYIYDDPYVYM